MKEIEYVCIGKLPPIFSSRQCKENVRTEISPYSKPQSYFEVSPSTLLIAQELALQFADAHQDLEHLNLTHATIGQTNQFSLCKTKQERELL